MKWTRLAATSAVIATFIAFAAVTSSATEKSTSDESVRRLAAGDLRYQGKTLNHWLKIIHDRDEEWMSVAFDAIRSLGPQASIAVPELTRIVAAPFDPVQIGKDSEETIASKLYDIEIRSEAIDALASIGEAAAPSAAAVVQWALTLRVLPGETITREEDEQFIELTALDAQYRMGVIMTVKRFGSPAVPTLKRLLKTPDGEKRKFVVATLGEEALNIAVDLLKSYDCEGQQLGIAILSDLNPVVPGVYLEEIKKTRACRADLESGNQSLLDGTN